jgi:hypothetical protein
MIGKMIGFLWDMFGYSMMIGKMEITQVLERTFRIVDLERKTHV